MNKKLIAVAVSSALAVPVIAQAEGEVKVYGRINQSIQLRDPTGGGSDLDQTTVSSRFGIRYDNDLGNGLAVHGRYEFDVRSDNETGITDVRIGTVGLSGAFGRVDVGNQWSAYYNSFGSLVSPAYTLAYYIYSSIGGGPLRGSNTIKYSNTFGPVSFQLDGRLNGSNEGSAVAEKLAGDGIGAGIRFDVGDYVTVGLAADYEDGPDLSSVTGVVGNDITKAGIANANSLAAARDVLAAAMVERADNKAESAQAMVRATVATNRALADRETADAARVTAVEVRDAHQLAVARQTIADEVVVETTRDSEADDRTAINNARGAITDADGAITTAEGLVEAAEARAKIARTAFDDATMAAEAANNNDAELNARLLVATRLNMIEVDAVTAERLALTTLRSTNAPTSTREMLRVLRAGFLPVAADTETQADERANALRYLVSLENQDDANAAEDAADDAADDAEGAADDAEGAADDAVAERDVIRAEVAAEVAVIDGAIMAADGEIDTANDDIDTAESNIDDIAAITNAITNDPARTDNTTRYGIAVKVKLGELPVSVTGGWQNYDVDRAGLDGDGDEVADVDVDSWFLWFAGDFNESTRWLLGYAAADGDAGEDADQFTWGVYHTIGGGLRLYYEGTSLDRDNPGDDFDGERHIVGLRIDF